MLANHDLYRVYPKMADWEKRVSEVPNEMVKNMIIPGGLKISVQKHVELMCDREREGVIEFEETAVLGGQIIEQAGRIAVATKAYAGEIKNARAKQKKNTY